MRFFVKGYSWDARLPAAGRPAPSRAEALAALERVGFPGTNTRYYREALAAFSVADYGHTLFCCEAAAEAGSDERWT